VFESARRKSGAGAVGPDSKWANGNGTSAFPGKCTRSCTSTTLEMKRG
jgi:hypothetical protein